MNLILLFFLVCYSVIGFFFVSESIQAFREKEKSAGLEYLVFFFIWLVSFAIPVIYYLL